MTIFNIISLLGGLALFLYGMRIMGDGLKYGSSGALKKAMEKVTNNPVVGFLLGLCVTAVIQSSTATIVITSGLVGAGIITLHQSLGVIIGANVGTTITGQIIRLLDLNADATSWLNIFKPSTLAPIAAIIGIILIMAVKSRNSDTLGMIAMGFGILFTGLLSMTEAVSVLSDSPTFSRLFMSLSDRPLLGFIMGTVVSLCIQSSSASVGILQALSITGGLSFGGIYAILLGIYMGDCITTAIVCAIGAKADARRTGIVHITFNIASCLLVVIVVTILHATGVIEELWGKTLTSGGIANVNTVFKLVCAVALLPLCNIFEKLSRVIVKDDKKERIIDPALEKLNEKLFDSPALALASVQEVLGVMTHMAFTSVDSAMNVLKNYNQAAVDKIMENEDHIDALTDKVSDYLVRLSPHVDTDERNKILNYYMQCVTEVERIGDYAVNLTEDAQGLYSKGGKLSHTAKAELDVLHDALLSILHYANLALCSRDLEAARHIEPIEEVMDDMVETLRKNHTKRLRDGKCTVDGGLAFMNILVSVERIADQCSNIGVYTVSLSDPLIQKTHHEYIRDLHRGSDPMFNEEYRKARSAFFNRIEPEK